MVAYFFYLVFEYFLNRLIRSNRVASISRNRLYIQPWNGYDAKMICKKGGNQKHSHEYKKLHYFIHHIPRIIRPKTVYCISSPILISAYVLLSLNTSQLSDEIQRLRGQGILSKFKNRIEMNQ